MKHSSNTPAQPAIDTGSAGPNSVEEWSLIDITSILRTKLLILIAVPMVATGCAFAATYLIAPTFTASAQLMPPQQQSSASTLLGSLGSLAGAVAGGSIGGLKNPSDQWVGLLKSRRIADALVERFKLQEIYESRYRVHARDALGSNSRIAAGKDGLIDIEVDDTSPERAALIANAYIEELQSLMKKLAVTEASQRRLFFEGQLKDAKDNLIKAETALKQGGINLSVLKTSPDASVSALAQLQAQVTAQEVTVSVMRNSMTSNNPDLRRAMTELNTLKQQLARVERADPAAATQDGGAYVSRFREFKYYETLFELVARQYELAKADEARDGTIIQVVDVAVAPELKSKPKRVLIAAVSGLAALMACIIFVFVNSALRIRVKTHKSA